MPLPPVPPLPADCRVETLRVWINALAECDLPESSCRSCLATARAVRALVEAKAREAVLLTKASLEPKVRSVDSIFEQIMGGAS